MNEHTTRALRVALLTACACNGDDAEIGATAFGSETSSTGNPTGGTGSPTTTTSPASTEESAGAEVSFDVAPISDVGVGPCSGDPKPMDPEFSYIWIPNSNEGTISKVDTASMTELARYRTGPTDTGHPALTSVNLRGDAVVANYFGGVTAIHARVDECSDPDATSSGRDDVLPWMDGCIAWHVPTDYESWVSVAWTSGVVHPVSCEYVDAQVWITGAPHRDGPLAALEVLLLDGETGAVDVTVSIDTLPQPLWGITGSATDRNGDLWFVAPNDEGPGELVRVGRESLVVETWESPLAVAGGFTIDEKGRIWACDHNMARFDPTDESWVVAEDLGGGGAGCMADGRGHVWTQMVPESPAIPYIIAFDIDDVLVVNELQMPHRIEGISHDYEGYTWAISSESAEAYRVDPDSGVYETLSDIGGAHDYLGPFSDMTGWTLRGIADPTPPE